MLYDGMPVHFWLRKVGPWAVGLQLQVVLKTISTGYSRYVKVSTCDYTNYVPAKLCVAKRYEVEALPSL